MKASGDIGRLHAFSVAGVNWTNPMTFEDCGRRALFCAMEDYKAGEEVLRYMPMDVASGPYQNVTRELTESDLADPE